jgi:HEAT repeat protein
LKNLSPIVLAESPAATIDLPKLDAKNADELIRRLSRPIGNDPWDAAQLAKWILMKADLADRKPALIDDMLRQVSAECSDSTQAAFLWALRSAGDDPKIINAVAGRLQSKSWLVRLMAIDTLGKLQDKSAKKIFEFYAANDCDDLVRKLCAGYLLRK